MLSALCYHGDYMRLSAEITRASSLLVVIVGLLMFSLHFFGNAPERHAAAASGAGAADGSHSDKRAAAQAAQERGLRDPKVCMAGAAGAGRMELLHHEVKHQHQGVGTINAERR